MRRKFGKVINELAKKDHKIVLLVGDIGYGIFDEFRKNHPNKFFNMGICEQSLIGVAAGMSLEGLKPWVYTITPFLIERPFEQIKLDIDQQKTNVKLVGFADYPTLGPTHKELDAKKLSKLFKNIKSFFPKNSSETEKFILKSYKIKGPTFISLKADNKIGKNW
jgi:transketolase